MFVTGRIQPTEKLVRNEYLFISDLHLTLEKPELTRRFLDFLQNRAGQAKALYILGDFFDAWVGDDDYTPPNDKIRKHLKQLCDSGTKVYLQQGNRDFLLGERFCRETGVVLLADYVLLDLFGVPTLLMHGDLLCSDDIAYLAFREKSHSDAWKNSMLSKPLFLRLLISRWYRLRSHFHKRRKTQDIMDVNQHTVLETMRKYQARRLIHGHTHRPGVHDFELDGQHVQRFVLANWSQQTGSVLCWNDNGYEIEPV